MGSTPLITLASGWTEGFLGFSADDDPTTNLHFDGLRNVTCIQAAKDKKFPASVCLCDKQRAKSQVSGRESPKGPNSLDRSYGLGLIYFKAKEITL